MKERENFDLIIFSYRIDPQGNGTCELSFVHIKETADLKPIGTKEDVDFDLYIKKVDCKLNIPPDPPSSATQTPITNPHHFRPPAQPYDENNKPVHHNKPDYLFKPQEFGPQKFPDPHTKPGNGYTKGEIEHRPNYLPHSPTYEQYVPDFLPPPQNRPSDPRPGSYGNYDRPRPDEFDNPNFVRPFNRPLYDRDPYRRPDHGPMRPDYGPERPDYKPIKPDYDRPYGDHPRPESDMRPQADRPDFERPLVGYHQRPYYGPSANYIDTMDRYSYRLEYPPRPSNRPQQLGFSQLYHGPSNSGFNYPMPYSPNFNNLHQPEHSFRPTYMVSILDSRRPDQNKPNMHNPLMGIAHEWDRKDTIMNNKNIKDKNGMPNGKGPMKPPEDPKSLEKLPPDSMNKDEKKPEMNKVDNKGKRRSLMSFKIIR